jgi:hypothetical protein
MNMLYIAAYTLYGPRYEQLRGKNICLWDYNYLPSDSFIDSLKGKLRDIMQT